MKNEELGIGNWGLVALTWGWRGAGFEPNIRVKWSRLSLNPPLQWVQFNLYKAIQNFYLLPIILIMKKLLISNPVESLHLGDNSEGLLPRCRSSGFQT
ncbi:MAG: hypothetical protein F6K47_14195 [Symploca sp. SIO2E6]|nr:hypothetical protein [Symploca sp. SIO2E6]